eukprot:364794-Chlamydomonas_euryale.AAC.13
MRRLAACIDQPAGAWAATPPTTSCSTSVASLSPPPLRSVSSLNSSCESPPPGLSAFIPELAFALLPPSRGIFSTTATSTATPAAAAASTASIVAASPARPPPTTTILRPSVPRPEPPLTRSVARAGTPTVASSRAVDITETGSVYRASRRSFAALPLWTYRLYPNSPRENSSKAANAVVARIAAGSMDALRAALGLRHGGKGGAPKAPHPGVEASRYGGHTNETKHGVMHARECSSVLAITGKPMNSGNCRVIRPVLQSKRA